jgi:sialic acid synthase SpsE
MNFLGKEIEPFESISIVAEISGNHGGDIKTAHNLIDIAKKAGADAVKLQAFTPDELTINNATVIKNGLWGGRRIYELYQEVATPLEWLPELFAHAKEINIPIFSSVFGAKSLQALEGVNCPAYKIASFEACDLELLKLVSSVKKPIIISTGTVSRQEIKTISSIVYNITATEPILMHCISDYPAKTIDLDLLRLGNLYGCTDYVGFSDHSAGMYAAMLAIARGVVIIERHIMDDKGKDVPDVEFSFFPAEFRQYVHHCNMAMKAFTPQDETRYTDNEFRRSLHTVKDVKAGEVITKDNVRALRPSGGLSPMLLQNILGSKATVDMPLGTPIQKDNIKHD